MVLRQNVSYDVYGTFCVESGKQTQSTDQNTASSHREVVCSSTQLGPR